MIGWIWPDTLAGYACTCVNQQLHDSYFSAGPLYCLRRPACNCSCGSDMEFLESDLQFVTKPSQDYFCPVCTEILTDPHLSDCGHHLCGSCRDRLLADNKAECPECKEPNLLKSARLNKHLQRQVKDLMVYCSHHDEGCKWKGEPCVTCRNIWILLRDVAAMFAFLVLSNAVS